MKEKRKVGIFVLILLLSIFIRSWKISEIPLPWIDEIAFGSLAFDIMNGGIGSHRGITILYFLAPFISILGLNLLSIRIPFVIFGILSILFTYYFFKNFYSKKVALLASFLLTTFPSHIYFSRVALTYIGATSFGILSIIFLYKFLQTRNRKYLFLFSLIASIGALIRLTLILFLIPVVALSIKFFKPKFKWCDLLISFIIFFLIISPHLYVTNTEEPKIVSILLKNFPITVEGVNLTDVGGNLARGFYKTLPQFMKGQMIFYLQDFASFSFLLLLSLSSTILLVKYIFKSKLGYKKLKEDKFLVGVIFFTSILLSTLTITTFREGDYLFLSPLIMGIIARGLVEIEEYLKKDVKYILYLLISVLVLFIFYEIINFFFYFHSLSYVEKITPQSHLFDYICIKSVKYVTDSLSKINYSRIFVDEGNVLPLTLIWYSQGEISKEDMSVMLVYTGDKETTIGRMIKELLDGLKDRNVVYVLTSENCLRFGPYHSLYREISPKNIFLNITKNYNKSVILESKILSPNGYVTYEIYRVA